jgi:hypothetical protein
MKVYVYIYIYYPNSIQFRKMITKIFHVQATNEDMQIFIIYKSLHSHWLMEHYPIINHGTNDPIPSNSEK